MEILTQNLGYLASGAVWTIIMSLISIAIGSVIGVCLGVIYHVSWAPVRFLIDVYIFVIRGIPILVLMFIMYYLFPALGYRLSNYTSVTLALVLYAGTYYADIMRGSLSKIPKGQYDAAKALGMPKLLMFSEVLVPQAVRPSISPWLNVSIVMVKSTSYASIVGAWELTYAAKEVVERTLAMTEVFGGAMILYFIICFPMSVLAKRAERSAAIAH